MTSQTRKAARQQQLNLLNPASPLPPTRPRAWPPRGDRLRNSTSRSLKNVTALVGGVRRHRKPRRSSLAIPLECAECVQQQNRNLPGCKLHDLRTMEHIGAEQFPHRTLTNAQLLRCLFRGKHLRNSFAGIVSGNAMITAQRTNASSASRRHE